MVPLVGAVVLVGVAGTKAYAPLEAESRCHTDSQGEEQAKKHVRNIIRDQKIFEINTASNPSAVACFLRCEDESGRSFEAAVGRTDVVRVVGESEGILEVFA